MAFLKKINVDAIKSTVEASVKAAQENVSNLNVEDMIQGAKDSVVQGAKDAVAAAQEGIKTAQENVSNLSVDGVVQGAKDAVTGGTEMISGAVEGIVRKNDDVAEESSAKELVALLWCLAYVDGAISDEEKETLKELSRSLDESYTTYAVEIEEEYIAKLQDASREFGAQNAAKIEAQRVIESIDNTSQDAKLLCWNLLTLANSDGLDSSELDFIRFVGEKTGIELAVFEELRNYSDAIVEVGESIAQLRLSDKSYTEIEPLVAEFATRQQEIMDAVQVLVADR